MLTAEDDRPVPPVGPTGQAERRRSTWWGACATLVLACLGSWLLADWWRCLPDETRAVYVGRQACAECHAAEMKLWQGSDHDRAMDLATDRTVLADFDDARITHHGIESRMFRRDGKFMIHTEGPDGKMSDFQVKYVLGVRPLQQYMVEFDRPADLPEGEVARVQVLRVSWDTEKKEWFYLPPPDVATKLDPSDDLHWTGIAQRWNNMCAYCHSTNLQKKFNDRTLTYHTTWSEIDVSCEACHGPASLHVELARSRSLFWDRKKGTGLAKLKTADTRPQIDACAPCHSRRQVYASHFRPGGRFYDHFNNELLDEATYYADGQIKDEDYVYGSFIQSKMYHKDIRCTDCHDPHTARLKHPGNETCTSCHQHAGAKYDSPAHHFHKEDSSGSLCVECHMPETTYMEVDPRRDHSIRIPRPDLSVSLGLPNACTRCHLTEAEISPEKRSNLHQYRDWMEQAEQGDKEIGKELKRLDQWALDNVKKWYRKEKFDDHYAVALAAGRRGDEDAAQRLAALATDRHWPAIARASAIRQRGFLRDVSGFAPEYAALKDPDPQVRLAAVMRFLDLFPSMGSQRLQPEHVQQVATELRPRVQALVPLLNDPARTVRAEAGRVLAHVPAQVLPELLNGAQRSDLDRAVDLYIDSLKESNDRGGAHLALGVLWESMGKLAEAESAYRKAMRVEPRLTGPRSNLAAVIEQQIEIDRRRTGRPVPNDAMAKRQAEVDDFRRQELDLLARDARLLPDAGAIQYRYGLSLYMHGERQKAEQALFRAVQLEPSNDQFLLALVLFYDKFGDTEKALQCARRLTALQPASRQYQELLKQMETKHSGAQ